MSWQEPSPSTRKGETRWMAAQSWPTDSSFTTHVNSGFPICGESGTFSLISMKKKPVWSGIGDFAWDAIRRWRQTYRIFLLHFQPARQWAPDPDRFRSTFLPE